MSLIWLKMEDMKPLIGLMLGLCGLLCGGVKDDLRAAEDRWAEAMKSGQAAALERACAAELIYGHSTGVTQTRAELIASMQTGERRYDSITWESFQVVELGQAALTHAKIRIVGKNAQGSFNDHLMLMHVWVKQKGEWRLAGHQTAKIP
jgi:ketosteroid isomerase-like protein